MVGKMVGPCAFTQDSYHTIQRVYLQFIIQNMAAT